MTTRSFVDQEIPLCYIPDRQWTRTVETKTLESYLAEHPLFRRLDPAYIKLLAGCAVNQRFDADQVIFRQGESADHFYLIRHGKVSVEIPVSHQRRQTIQTIGEDEVLGWSWLFPPYAWHFDARALDPTRAVALDAACLRGKCEEDPALGYLLMQRVSVIMLERLQAARLQLLDLYGPMSA